MLRGWRYLSRFSQELICFALEAYTLQTKLHESVTDQSANWILVLTKTGTLSPDQALACTFLILLPFRDSHKTSPPIRRDHVQI